MTPAAASDLAARPAPPSRGLLSTGGYRNLPIDLADPRNAEPLATAAGAGLAAASAYAATDGLNPPYGRAFEGAEVEVRLRTGVLARLVEVKARLAPLGLEPFLLDGYRPIRMQQALWDFFIARARAEQPQADATAHERFAAQFISDPRRFDPADPTSWPIHSTGGAVDLTLRRLSTGELLHMGGVFDDPSPQSFSDHYERLRRRPTASDEAARTHRRILIGAMTDAGFTNYPAEWWHFDYGTQMWALIERRQGRAATAFYGTLG